MNEILQNIITRRSCKSFREEMIPQEAVEQIVQAGLHAASWMGRQMPLVLAVIDRQTRDRLSALNAKYDRLKRPDPFYGAPVVLCVVAPQDDPAALEDGSLVLGNMMLAAHALGIGSCWIHRAREVFEDPEGIAILRRAGIEEPCVGVGHCVLGYAKTAPKGVIPRRENRVFRI